MTESLQIIFGLSAAEKTVRQGIRHLLNGLAQVTSGYSCKVDIHNYFNSIPVHRLLPMLENIFGKDAEETAFCAGCFWIPGRFLAERLFVRKKGPWRGCRCPLFFAMYI